MSTLVSALKREADGLQASGLGGGVGESGGE